MEGPNPSLIALRHLADAPWWRSVFFDQVGASLIGGLIAFAIALVTVKRTLAGERAAFEHQLERQQEIALEQQSRVAAAEINRATRRLRRWIEDPADPAYDEWQETTPSLVVMISDRELQRRVIAFALKITDYAHWREDRRGPSDGATAAAETDQSMPDEAAMRDYIHTWINWVALSLNVHQIGQSDLPERPEEIAPGDDAIQLDDQGDER